MPEGEIFLRTAPQYTKAIERRWVRRTFRSRTRGEHWESLDLLIFDRFVGGDGASNLSPRADQWSRRGVLSAIFALTILISFFTLLFPFFSSSCFVYPWAYRWFLTMRCRVLDLWVHQRVFVFGFNFSPTRAKNCGKSFFCKSMDVLSRVMLLIRLLFWICFSTTVEFRLNCLSL